jgi:hypothetical protein
MAVANTKATNKITMTPSDLKTTFEALQIAPTYLSKRFIMMELLGWSEELIAKNADLRTEEANAEKIGNKSGAYR